jgi:NhaA family Na+:H+ antiporter
LANAGIAFDMKGDLDLSLAVNIALALILGKSVGITVFSLIATQFGISTLPNGVTVWRIIGAGFLAGIGFTMSIFITNLAFVGEADFIASAKIGVLIGSVLAALAGFLILKKSTSE